jgi:prophage regulatory protein
MRLIRLPEVKSKTGHARTTIYEQIQRGLLPPPVRTGIKSSAWPDIEIDAINAARIAGKTRTEIRALVARLVANRKKLATEV